MSQESHQLVDYINHILAAIDRIQRYCADADEVVFLLDEMLQDAVIRNFEVIGEASKNIDRKFPDFLRKNPSLPLIDAYEMRNSLAHGYFKVDLEILWNTIHKHLPDLQVQLASLRK
jgi:uncharacterized protein with HEPN domain